MHAAQRRWECTTPTLADNTAHVLAKLPLLDRPCNRSNGPSAKNPLNSRSDGSNYKCCVPVRSVSPSDPSCVPVRSVLQVLCPRPIRTGRLRPTHSETNAR